MINSPNSGYNSSHHSSPHKDSKGDLIMIDAENEAMTGRCLPFFRLFGGSNSNKSSPTKSKRSVSDAVDAVSITPVVRIIYIVL